MDKDPWVFSVLSGCRRKFPIPQYEVEEEVSGGAAFRSGRSDELSVELSEKIA
jgi:hypothetical protein